MPRHRTRLWGIALAMLLALSACAADDSGATAEPQPVLPVRSVLGTFSLVGVWAWPCESSGSAGSRTMAYFTPGTATYNTLQWSSDAKCSGAAPATTLVQGSLPAIQGLSKVVPWATATPDGLDNTVTATRLLPDARGQQTKDIAYVDDSGDPARLYTGDLTSTADADGYPSALRNVRYTSFISAPVTALDVRSVNGSVSLLGSWASACTTVNTTDGQIVTYEFGRTVSHRRIETYGGDTTCAGTVTATEAHYFNTADPVDNADTPWTGAPPTGVDATVLASTVDLTYIAETVTDTALYFVDDTVSPQRLYIGSTSGAGALDSTTDLSRQ